MDVYENIEKLHVKHVLNLDEDDTCSKEERKGNKGNL